jgi:putative ATP-dependent endonuclease of the OLD family
LIEIDNFETKEMKLVEIRIKNFRAIGSGDNERGLHLQIDKNNIIFLIGKNNAGKSSVLNAYDYFFNDKSAKGDDFRSDKNSPIEIEVQLRLESSDEVRQLKILDDYPDLKNDEQLRVKKEWSYDQPEKSKKFIWVESKWKELSEGQDKKTLKELQDLLERELPTPIWIKGMSTSNEISNVIKNLIKKTVLKSLEESEEYREAENSMRKLQDLVSQDTFSKDLKEMISLTLQKTFPTVSLDISNETVGKNDLMKSIEGFTQIRATEDDQKSVSLDWQGHGLQRQIIFSVYKDCHQWLGSKKTENVPTKPGEKTNILLIEEPELFLHPTAIRSTRNLLYELAESSEFQILCATHSPIMIDIKRPHNSLVRIVKHKQYGSLAYQVSEFLPTIGMMEDFNPHVCESFFADKVILVEGNTEAIAIKLLIERFGKDCNNQISDDFHIVNCNGKATIPGFQNILNHFKIDYFVFHDCDSEFVTNGNRSPAWETNKKIWNKIEYARSIGIKARRFVSLHDFESSNGYTVKSSESKPTEAYSQVKKWLKGWSDSGVQDKPIIRYVKEIAMNKNIEEDHTQDWLEKKALASTSSSSSSLPLLALLDLP